MKTYVQSCIRCQVDDVERKLGYERVMKDFDACGPLDCLKWKNSAKSLQCEFMLQCLGGKSVSWEDLGEEKLNITTTSNYFVPALQQVNRHNKAHDFWSGKFSFEGGPLGKMERFYKYLKLDSYFVPQLERFTTNMLKKRID